MDRETFEKILVEEGIDDAKLRMEIWNTRPSGDILEYALRQAAKKFKTELPDLLIRKSLSAALDREYNKN